MVTQACCCLLLINTDYLNNVSDNKGTDVSGNSEMPGSYERWGSVQLD